MSSSESLNYYPFKKFCEMTTMGQITPMNRIHLPNISGDQIHKIPYHTHLLHSCKQNDENILSTCSALMNQINSDMIRRLEQSPIFREKVMSVIKENNFEDDVQCSEIFPTHEERFNYADYLSERKSVSDILNEIEGLNKLSEEDEIYDTIESLVDMCDECNSRISHNMDELKATTRLYQPKYGSILLDLGTRHKPFYMEGFLKNPTNAQIVRRINKEVSQRIPDNIETIMMNVGLWLPQCLLRESRRVQLDYKKMQDELGKKKVYLLDMKQRLPDPRQPYSSQPNFLQNLVQTLLSVNDSDEEQDEPELSSNQSQNINMMEIEDKIKKELKKADSKKSVKKVDKKEPVYELSLLDDKKPQFYSSDEDMEEEDMEEEDDSDLN